MPENSPGAPAQGPAVSTMVGVISVPLQPETDASNHDGK